MKIKPTWPTLAGRLNHPLTSRVEAIRQLQTMVPLSPLAQRILEREGQILIHTRTKRLPAASQRTASARILRLARSEFRVSQCDCTTHCL